MLFQMHDTRIQMQWNSDHTYSNSLKFGMCVCMYASVCVFWQATFQMHFREWKWEVHWRINAALGGDELTNVRLLPIITQSIYLMNGKTKLNVPFFQWIFESLLWHASGAVYSKRSVWTFTVIHTVFHSHVAVKVYDHFQDHDKYSYPGTPLKTFHSAGVSGLDPSYYTMPGATAPWLHDVLYVYQGKYEYWHIICK